VNQGGRDTDDPRMDHYEQGRPLLTRAAAYGQPDAIRRNRLETHGRNRQSQQENASVSDAPELVRDGVTWSVPVTPPHLGATAARALLRLMESAARRRAEGQEGGCVRDEFE
jgi:hypothetical protein